MISYATDDQGHPLDKQGTADWLGCTIEEMDRDHDMIHEYLVDNLVGKSSFSLRNKGSKELQELEEHMALAVQRFWYAYCKEFKSADNTF